MSKLFNRKYSSEQEAKSDKFDVNCKIVKIVCLIPYFRTLSPPFPANLEPKEGAICLSVEMIIFACRRQAGCSQDLRSSAHLHLQAPEGPAEASGSHWSLRSDARSDALEVGPGLEPECPGSAGGGDQHLLSLHLAGRPLLSRLPQNSPIPAVTPGVGRSALQTAH